MRSRQTQVMDGDGKRRLASVCNGVPDQDKTVISKIMQQFRPIAPKPTVGESSEDTKSCRFLGRNRRSKRKYVRVRDKKNSSGCNNNSRMSGKKNGCAGGNKKTDLDKEIDGDDRSDVVTLQLLPEKERDLGNNGDQAGEYCSDLSDMNPKTSLYGSIVGLSSSLDRTMVESWLRVECVSDTCTDLGDIHILKQLGRMDQGEERLMRMLEDDTCPWLVSDGENRVCWVNRAYRRMIGASDVEVIRVWLVGAMDLMEEISCLVELYGAVTCRVRYEPSTWRKMTVPCDVWRIRSGEFAWRLDVETALRLGM